MLTTQGLGQYAVQFAVALGHPCVAIDNRKEGLELAKSLPHPPDLVIDFNDRDAVSKIKTWAGRDGVAAVLGCTDKVEATEWSLNILRPGGICVPVGLPVEPFRISAFTLNFQQHTVKGSLVATRNQVQDMMDVCSHQFASPFSLCPLLNTC